MNQIKAILFDIGGVILRHPKSPNTEVLSKIFSKPVSEITPYYEKEKKKYFCGEIDTEDFFQLCIYEFKSELQVDDVSRLWVKEYSKLRMIDTRMLDVVDKLKGQVIRCVFSNTLPANYEVNQKAGLFDAFDRLYFSFQIGYSKPDPEFYQYALKDLGLDPQSVLLVDDRQKNLTPAKALGLQVFHYDILVHSPRVLQNLLTMKGLLL